MSGAKKTRLQAAACPASLLPHPDVVQLLEELLEVMAITSFETSLILARLRENYFRRVDQDVYIYIYICIIVNSVM